MAEGSGRQLLSISLVDGISISNHMAKNPSADTLVCRFQNVGAATNAGGSSSLSHYDTALIAETGMRGNTPENYPAFAAARVKHKRQAIIGTITSNTAAFSTARAPLQQHLHFLHATPRHTLHYPPSPARRRPVHHVHTGRRGSQSMARGRSAAAHDAHWNTRQKLREHVSKRRRRHFPMPLQAGRLPRKEPLLDHDKFEWALDVRVKLLRGLQLAVEGQEHSSASEAILKCENVGRLVGGGGCDHHRHQTCNSLL